MYAAHFAAALAVKAAEPRAPTIVLVVLASAPDLLWLGLSAAGPFPAAPHPETVLCVTPIGRITAETSQLDLRTS